MHLPRYLILVLLCLTSLVGCERDTVPTPPAESGQLELKNTAATVSGETPPGFFDTWLTMSRIATVPTEDENGESTGWENLEVQDTATLQLRNLSADAPLYLNSLSLDTDAFTLVAPPTLPLEIAPGASFDLTVKFVASNGELGVRRGVLSVDSSGGTFAVQLAGVFMQVPEGDNEVNLQQIVDAFGYKTDIGLENGVLSEVPTSPLAGDEVRANFWEQADPDRPVYVRELAAYHGCCNEENFIELIARDGESLGAFFHAASYAQSVLPLKSGGAGPAEMSVDAPTGDFEIVVGAVGDTYSTNTDGNLGVRLWPVKDSSGELVADAYIIAEDYVQNGCGEGNANCDYQDNVFLITNVRPVR